jgi:thiamine pyrophosphate-dependent acetolactate synthase large subunit-like protein
MSSAPHTTSKVNQSSAAQVVIDALLRCGISTGFGIPSIHNIALYDALRQQPAFHHWIVRHEQAAVFAADGYSRRSGKTAAVFASTGPGNLFTVAPLLESFQTNTPVVVIGTNVASQMLGKTCGALHETPRQLEIFKPLVRFSARVTSPDTVSRAIAAAANAGGPAFVEIPHDLLLAPSTPAEGWVYPQLPESLPFPDEIEKALEQIGQGRKPVVVLGSDVMIGDSPGAVQELAEALQAPVLTTTSGKGAIADDHPLAMGCISRLGVAQELLLESDLMISVGARFTEFDTGRFSLRVPSRHIQIERDLDHVGLQFPFTARLIGDIAAIAQTLTSALKPRPGWSNIAAKRTAENERLKALGAEAYEALLLLRSALDRNDVVANDQSILNYWASAFFPVLAPRSWLYPTGSGTLGYGLPAAIGAACAAQQDGRHARVVCIAGDGGFQYTSHELATVAHYGLPVKIFLVNDNAYGIIGFLQRTLFGHTHEINLQNPDFCRLAEAYDIAAQRVADFDALRRQLPGWLNSSGPALLEWRTEIKAPWEVGAINRPPMKQ